jgi:hypothetical protein
MRQLEVTTLQREQNSRFEVHNGLAKGFALDIPLNPNGCSNLTLQREQNSRCNVHNGVTCITDYVQLATAGLRNYNAKRSPAGFSVADLVDLFCQGSARTRICELEWETVDRGARVWDSLYDFRRAPSKMAVSC